MLRDMPWYDDYLLIIDGKSRLEVELDEIRNPRKKYEAIMNFYESVGADYRKNKYLIMQKASLSENAAEKDVLVDKYTLEIGFANALEKAITQMDEKSISALVNYRNTPRYRQLIGQVMFYLGIKNVETDASYIVKAYDAVLKRYPLTYIGEFVGTGSKYFLQYWESVEKYVKNNKKNKDFEEAKGFITDKIRDYNELMEPYIGIRYLDDFRDQARDIITRIENRIAD